MPDRPNIILLMTDQHRGDCIGLEGRHPVLTPNLDGMAAQGVRFSSAYSTCPECMPARRSLLSGQFPATHGLLGNQEGLKWDAPRTLVSALRDGGYETALVGRDMHQYPTRQRLGFDSMVTQQDYWEWLDRQVPIDVEHRCSEMQGASYSTGVMHNDWTARPWPYHEDLHSTNWTITEARRFLRRRDPTCPFFLVVSFISPHPPLIPPKFYFERYLRMTLPEPTLGSWTEAPPGIASPAGAKVCLESEIKDSCLAGYYGSINHLDDQIRRIIYHLHGIKTFDLDNTVVVFTSDHGEMLGDHYRWRKSLPYEGSSRIPLIMRAPARFGCSSGKVVERPVCLEDVMPTLLDFAGVTPPNGVQGQSLLPLLRGEPVTWREFVHIEQAAGSPTESDSFHAPGFHALTDGVEKYIWFSGDGSEQLFDLGSDPGEMRDLSCEPSLADRLSFWRKRLVDMLRFRPEGFVRSDSLQSGREHRRVVKAIE